MKAKTINEDNVFIPKDKEKILYQYIDEKIWDLQENIFEMINHIDKNGISVHENNKLILEIFKERFDGLLNYTIDTYE